MKPWFPFSLSGEKVISRHYSHRNSDCPYSINTFISQCDLDLITNLWQHELRTTKKSEVTISRPFGVFTKHSPCFLCTLSSLLCSTGHNASRIPQRFTGCALVNGGLSNSRLEKLPLGSFFLTTTGGFYGLNCVPPKLTPWSSKPPMCLHLEIGLIRRWLWSNEVIRWGSDMIAFVLLEETPESDPTPHPPCASQSSCEHTYKPAREISIETDHAGTLILDFQPPELWENKCLVEASQSMALCYGRLSRLRQWSALGAWCLGGCPLQPQCSLKTPSLKHRRGPQHKQSTVMAPVGPFP